MSKEFTYSFSIKELKILLKFLRTHEKEIVPVLENFMDAAEKQVYNTMTIQEAEQFLL